VIQKTTTTHQEISLSVVEEEPEAVVMEKVVSTTMTVILERIKTRKALCVAEEEAEAPVSSEVEVKDQSELLTW